MAKTPAQKQRDYRRRSRERLKAAPDLVRQRLSDSGFVAFMNRAATNWDGESGPLLDSVGATLPGWGEHDFPPGLQAEYEAILGEPYPGALGRAERTIEHLIALARLLASDINTFKLSRIEAELKQLETTKPGNPDAMRETIAEAAALQELKSRLSKEVRFSIPSFTVKGG